jgi:transglutaminase-like putative cysteine protease
MIPANSNGSEIDLRTTNATMGLSIGGGSLAISKVSVLPGRGRAFRWFLFVTLAISISAATIENGLNVLALLFLPLIFAAIFRKNYAAPFLWSEKMGTMLFFLYVPLSLIVTRILPGAFTLPVFIAYFTFGLLMVRILSPFTDRNIWQIVFLSVGMILINCILTNHLVFGLILPVYLFFLLGTLLLFHLASNEEGSESNVAPQKEKGLWNSWYGSLARLTLVILAFTVILFIFFPRPFLVIPGLRTAMSAAGGFAQLEQNITYKDMAAMTGRKRIAFTAHLEQGALPKSLYWRGRVLEKTDGFSWSQDTTARGIGDKSPIKLDSSIVYTVSPHRLQSKNLYVVGAPIFATGLLNRPLQVTSQGEVLVDSTFLFSDTYRIRALVRPIPVDKWSRKINLDQSGITPRIAELAQQWTKGFSKPRDKAGAIASKLRSEYKYSLQAPPPPDKKHPIEHFLFDTKLGHCEYFAGALCMMLRSEGIPARVVEGFAGVERTSSPNDFIVRFSRAHAWVEADLDGVNWTTLDATPGSLGESADSFLWRALVDFYDDLEYKWIKYVVYYDRADQAELVKGLLALFSPSAADEASLSNSARFFAPLIIFGASVVVIGILILKLRHENQDPSGLYRRTMLELMKKGLLTAVHPWQEKNVEEILRRAPSLKLPLAKFMKMYLKCRFGNADQQLQAELSAARDELMAHVTGRNGTVLGAGSPVSANFGRSVK